MTSPYLARGRRKPPPEPHPIDAKAAEIRAAENVRRAVADALDEIAGKWELGRLETPLPVVLDHIRTVFFAGIEEERAREGSPFRDKPAIEPWSEFA